MLRPAFPISAVFLASPALAEVCDKYSESWHPSDGPLDLWTVTNSLPLILVSGGIAGCVLLFRSRSLALLGSVAFGAAFLLNLYVWLAPDWLAPDPILASAIREGCMAGSPPSSLVGAVVYGLLSLGFLLLARSAIVRRVPAGHRRLTP